VSRCQKKLASGLGLCGGRKDNKRQTDTPTIRLGVTPSRLISNPPPSSLPFLCGMPFLPQPSQFILVWDRQQICWLAYTVAWSIKYPYFSFK